MSTRENQRELSEMLQLLIILDKHPVGDTGTEEFFPSKGGMVELKILEDLAFFLTPRSTDLIAVTLERNIPLTFILAKNRGVPDRKDQALARAFFLALRDAMSWRDVMPCLMVHAAECVNEMLASLSKFPYESLFNDKSQYKPGSLEEEFPVELASQLTNIFETTDPIIFLKGLFSHICDRSNFGVDLASLTNPMAVKNHLDRFADILETIQMLYRTKFLRQKLYDGMECAIEYQSRAFQVIRYITGIEDLIAWRRRFMEVGSDIHYQWLNDECIRNPEAQSDGDTVQLSESPWAAIQGLSRLLGSNELISYGEYGAHSSSPRLEEQWNSRVTRPTRHLVPRMIAHLSQDTIYTIYPRLIGSSSPHQCLCCARWVTEFNDRRGYRGGGKKIWMTRNSTASKLEVASDWGLIGGSGSEMDAEVYQMVVQRLVQVMKELGLLRSVPSYSLNFRGMSAPMSWAVQNRYG